MRTFDEVEQLLLDGASLAPQSIWYPNNQSLDLTPVMRGCIDQSILLQAVQSGASWIEMSQRRTALLMAQCQPPS